MSEETHEIESKVEIYQVNNQLIYIAITYDEI